MKEPKAPKIEFPCEYPIRIVGHAAPDYKDFVLQVVAKHDSEFDGKAKMKTSRNGKYLSATVVIMATGEPQLQALFEELKASGRIQMVL
ncbi:YbeD family protein [Endozoicomonas sp.]|uniref:HP0495 family protein n=1 Tax=Endozoicomonas sp. TaxID=1892382 RepID=UPI00383A30B7